MNSVFPDFQKTLKLLNILLNADLIWHNWNTYQICFYCSLFSRLNFAIFNIAKTPSMGSRSIFVSYSSKDRPFAEGLVGELRDLGVDAWIDQTGIKLGENWDNAIEEALEKSDTFMLLISPSAVKSPNVQDEASIAFSSDKTIVPILIKNCDLPMRWKRRQYVDLTQNHEKGLKDIIGFFELKENIAFNKLKDVLSLISDSETSDKPTIRKSNGNSFQEEKSVSKLADHLPSEAEIDHVADIARKGIKKNKQLVIFVAILSIILLGGLMLMNVQISMPKIVIGCLSINLLSIAPLGNIKKRERIIGLLDLLKLKRERLIRVINKLSDSEIEEFNSEFESYISM